MTTEQQKMINCKTKRNIYQMAFVRILNLFPELKSMEMGDSKKLSVPHHTFMDLSLNILNYEPETQEMRISLTHYYEQNGDLCPDPDMEISVNFKMETAEALTFQMANIYQVVYPAPDKVYPRLKRELNDFLRQWLKNLHDQGFCNRVQSDTPNQVEA